MPRTTDDPAGPFGFNPPGSGPCGIRHTLSVMSGKWTLLIVRELLRGARRFTEIREGIGSVNPKPLTESLRQLEDNGMITRRAYAEMPPRVEYELTERGRSLAPVLAAMAQWGQLDVATYTDGHGAAGQRELPGGATGRP
jgi:DNA-binding HxlR family transcriptional regulator